MSTAPYDPALPARVRIFAVVFALLAALTLPAGALQTNDDEPNGPSQEELDQMLAPLALYPDELLSQVLMASTYPLELVEAARFAKANPDLEGDALTKALEEKDWDPSVKSLVNFPDVLKSLDDQLEWTRKIGDAFLADQKAVLDTVQKLRSKAKEAGNLESTEEMTVTTEASAESVTKEIIVIESAKPDVVYVPVYDPVVVYGTWWWPAYPPPVYYRPPYYRPGIFVTFGVGFAMGAAWGYAWGGCSWRRSSVNINVNRNVNINANIDRNRYKTQVGGGRGEGTWQHDPKHRKGVEYKDRATAKKFEGKSRADAQRARESYRGRANADRESLSRARSEGRIDSQGRSRERADRGDRSSSTRSRSQGSNERSRDRSGSRSSERSKSRSSTRSSGRSGAFTGHRGSHSSSRASSRGKASRSRSGGRAARGGRGR
ncbi:MAG: DUF3300 domain-containing protein [Planctomycetota bacterium]